MTSTAKSATATEEERFTFKKKRNHSNRVLGNNVRPGLSPSGVSSRNTVEEEEKEERFTFQKKKRQGNNNKNNASVGLSPLLSGGNNRRDSETLPAIPKNQSIKGIDIEQASRP